MMTDEDKIAHTDRGMKTLPRAGFYASSYADGSYCVLKSGAIFELTPDPEREVRVDALPRDAERFDRELPSMIFRMARFLGLDMALPSDSTHLLIDEVHWDGKLQVAPFDEAVAELAVAGLVRRRGGSVIFSEHLGELLNTLSHALVGRPFESGDLEGGQDA